MHPWSEVERVRRLSREGANASAIARITGLPRSTVRDWLRGTRTEPPESPSVRCAQLPRAEYAYLLGLYLGDGYLVQHKGGVWRLRVTLDRRYPEIIRECAASMGAVLPNNRVHIQRRRDGCTEVGAYSQALPGLFPQHGPGAKHTRSVALTGWQRTIAREQPARLIRGLLHSDGSRSLNTIRRGGRTYRYPRYQFSNRSADIRQLFCWTCDELGIDWRHMNAWTISVARRASVARLDCVVGPKR